jgi:hypothetical protein
MMQATKPGRYATALLLTALAVTGCSARSAQSTQAAAAGQNASPAAPAASASVATRVPITQTYNVTYKPGTKVIDAPTVAGAYQGVGSDGSLLFDARSAPAVAALTPQSVVIFAGLALRRVVSVAQAGNTLHVFTGPATLDEAIADGHIAWELPVAFGRVAFAPPPGFHRVFGPSVASAWQQPFLAEALADEPGYTFSGTVEDWDVTVKLVPDNGDLHMDLDAGRTIGGGKIELHGIGELDSLTNSVNITLSNGTTTQLSFDNKNLHGKLDMTWNVAFDKEHGGESVKEFSEPEVSNLPLGFSLPFLVGPLPFKLEFKTGFAFQPVFTSKVTVAQGEYHTTFGGALSVNDGSGSAGPGPDSQVNFTGGIDSSGGTLSVAPLGLSATLAMPKIVLTLGVPDALDNVLGELRSIGDAIPRSDALTPQSEPFKKILGETDAGPYADIITQITFIATGPLAIVPCERRELHVSAIVGVSASLFGHDLAAVEPKTVVDKQVTEILPKNITLCKN